MTAEVLSLMPDTRRTRPTPRGAAAAPPSVGTLLFDADGTLLIGSDGTLLFDYGGTLLIDAGGTPVIGDWPPEGTATDTGASEETSFLVVSGDTPESCSARGDLAIYDGTGAEAAF